MKSKTKKIIIGVISFLIVIAVVIGLTMRKKGNNHKETESNTVNKYEYVSAEDYFNILLDDCSLYVGSKFKLEWETNKKITADEISWSTSDSEIVIVDSKGNIEVISDGTAFVTATCGYLTDSIVIVGIKDSVETNEDGEIKETETALPIFIVDEKGSVAPLNPIESSTTVSGEPAVKPTVELPTTTSRVDTPTTQAIVTQPPATKEPQQETTAGQDELSMYDVLITNMPELGYKKLKNNIDNIYIFEEDGNYLGEVIVNDSFVQIYIQTRTTRYDEAIRALIKNIIPNEYNSVYSAFVNASTATTIKKEGHTVRIRPSSGENHAQLIIMY